MTLKRGPCQGITCYVLIGAIGLSPAAFVGDEPLHTHVEFPVDNTFFIGTMQPSMNTTASVASLLSQREQAAR